MLLALSCASQVNVETNFTIYENADNVHQRQMSSGVSFGVFTPSFAVLTTMFAREVRDMLAIVLKHV